MGCVKIFPLGRVRVAQSPLMQIWDPHIVSNTIYWSQKVEIKNTIRCGKVLASGTLIFPLGGVHAAQGRLM